MKRKFDEWFKTFTRTLRNYSFWVDWVKVKTNVSRYKDEFNILNGLVGSNDPENEFKRIVKKYPRVIECIPILFAIRSKEIELRNETIKFISDIATDLNSICNFMREAGLFKMLSTKQISNVFDYATGVEVGLDSNARKNRGGADMSTLVESYFKKSGIEYYKEMSSTEISSKFKLDLSKFVNSSNALKRFDFVFKRGSTVYGVEVNFYSSGGSKLNETARSYKQIAQETKNIKGFKFVWITDGAGWITAKHNLEETFNQLEDIYNINDLDNDILEKM